MIMLDGGIPAYQSHLLTKNKLPLPLFIHRDDIEYGLLQMENLFLLNGNLVYGMKRLKINVREQMNIMIFEIWQY